ncbi:MULTISPECIES: helix-turn-helix domain-containing protein [Pseudomonas]|uniref:HTH cro/C1-type domain-containing protein n=1 Tax=Pseudomonas oryzihabitans TaxID=47885 RepID=A0A0U4WZZ7_9PSED|nr:MULTISPECIES: helix-turn-helix transcriptional regulator [Pseudomonas]ALZ84724.1 hypothetical protein APT59_11150 [Pseudomonas oryzihabitans]
MSSIGSRLKEERERLGMSQGVFGEIGGVKTNAQVKYEKDERSPDALYLEALSRAGVDVSFVITGQRSTAISEASVGPLEAEILLYVRGMSDYNKESVRRMAFAMAAADGSLDSDKP